MKIRRFPAAVTATVTLSAFVCLAASTVAQDSATFGPVPPPSTPPPVVERVQLSGGVEDVLKLSRAKVNEDVIIAFVQNGNRSFSLSAAEILYLRKEGVADRVLTTMLGQPAPPEATSPPPATSMFASEASAPQYISQPSYVEPAPVSTVYVGTPSYYSYYDPWPYWSSWYPYPAFSFGFYWGWGWGGCGYWSYPSYCYPNYCYNGSWNNYCNNGYSSVAATRPQAANNAALVSEMRQPSGVSRARPLVSEMRQPSGVNQSTLVSEGRQPSGVNQGTRAVSGGRDTSGVAGANQAARSGVDRVENRSASSTSASPTSNWTGNGNRPAGTTSPGSSPVVAAKRTSGMSSGRTTESRGTTRSVANSNPTSVWTGSANQRPAAPTYANQGARTVSRTGTIGSRPASPSVNRSMSSPTMSSQRSFSPSRSSGSVGGASRPSMSSSFSSRGSAGAVRGGSSGFSGGASRSVASGGGGFRGGGGGGGGRSR